MSTVRALRPAFLADATSSAIGGPAAVVATTQPGVFEERLGEVTGRTVHVVSTSAEALSLLASTKVDLFFADFRELADRWTGRQFLKHIRGDAKLAGVKVYLMAERWEPHQEAWLKSCGAEGFVRRSPGVLARMLETEVDEAVTVSATLKRELRRIEELFGPYAGPMKAIHIADAQEALELGVVEPAAPAYVLELASKLVMPERREAFKRAAAAMLGSAPARGSHGGRSVGREG